MRNEVTQRLYHGANGARLSIRHEAGRSELRALSAERMRMKQAKALQMVTPQAEAILKAVHFYRYVTASDIAYLLYSPKSLTYVRNLLSDLAGNADFVSRQYLYRFRMPRVSVGNSERVYTLGSRGRDYLATELGLPVEWYFRPQKTQNMGYSQMTHNIILTRFLVAAQHWCQLQSAFRLARMRISYELAEQPATVVLTQEGRRRVLKVIPDAWLGFIRVSDGRRFPILLEIDRGTQYQKKFKEQIRARIEYIRSELYKRTFRAEAVMIAYVTTGGDPAARATRCKTLCLWTNQVLEEMGMNDWSSIFRFHALALDEMYTTSLFVEPVWYRPDVIKPVSLFVD